MLTQTEDGRSTAFKLTQTERWRSTVFMLTQSSDDQRCLWWHRVLTMNGVYIDTDRTLTINGVNVDTEFWRSTVFMLTQTELWLSAVFVLTQSTNDQCCSCWRRQIHVTFDRCLWEKHTPHTDDMFLLFIVLVCQIKMCLHCFNMHVWQEIRASSR